MKVSDTVFPRVLVTDTAGAAVTGLTSSGFTLVSELDGAAQGTSFTVAEIGSGYYRITFTAPSATGCWVVEIRPASASHYVSGGRFIGVLTARDEDDLAALVTRPAYLALGTNTAQAVTIDLVAYRQAALSYTIRDQAGVVVPGTGYTNFRFSIRTVTGGSIYTLSSGITWDGAGLLSWIVPENASIFSQIDAEITAGRDSLQLRYDLVGDAGGVATATRTILRGPLNLLRYETPA